MKEKVDFLTFFFIWADRMGWEVPDVHVRACHWLEHRGLLAVLRCFRGFGKSTLLAVYNAWCYYIDPTYRILHQGESNPTAYKTSRDTQNVLRNHPLTQGLLPDGTGTVEQWWVNGSNDARNASMYARGILSNVTSARASECQNDDVEASGNAQTPESREKMRYRLGEQTHILIPGGKKLFIGTPHTHKTIYDEIEALGADCLTIRMFQKEQRIDDAQGRQYSTKFRPEFVFTGIGKDAKLLDEGKDYRLEDGAIFFTVAPGCLVDLYAESSWPERFDRAEMLKRRRETRTIGEFDSQYQLHSTSVVDVRLDPEHLRAYEAQPNVVKANGEIRMMLGQKQIVSARAYWDCSLGKINSDASALSIILEDDAGNSYWHVAEGLTGEFAEFKDDKNGHITGGQVMQACALLRKYQIPMVYVENNGVGAFVPQLLRKAMKQERLYCAVREVTQTTNKNIRILNGIEGPLRSGVLWAHTSVLDGPLWDQMKEWNPEVRVQPDDFLESGANAILEAPVRIGKVVGDLVRIANGNVTHDWRPNGGVFEVSLETQS